MRSECFLKDCDTPGPRAHSSGATSALRANATGCAFFRGTLLAPPSWAAAWRQRHGRQTFEEHVRGWDHGEVYAPILTIRALSA